MNKEEIITALNNGGTILYPTDTIWGLGCDATNEAACQKIIQIKKRSEEKSFIILVDGFQMLEKYVPEFPNVCYDLVDLADKPLTIIYPNAKGLAPSVLAADGSVGIRVTKDPSCLALIRGLKKPLVSTSANFSGGGMPRNFEEIHDEIKQGVDVIVEGDPKQIRTKASQIIKIGLDSTIQIIRK